MPTTPKRPLALAALVAAAAVPVAPALAASHGTPPGSTITIEALPGGKAELRGSPQVRDVAAGAGTLHFAATKIPRTASGRIDGTVTMPGGVRVGPLRLDGTHGTDATYAARVTGGIEAGTKHTLTFRLGSSPAVKRSVKAYAD